MRQLGAKLLLMAVLTGCQVEWKNLLAGNQIDSWSSELQRQSGRGFAGLQLANNKPQIVRRLNELNDGVNRCNDSLEIQHPGAIGGEKAQKIAIVSAAACLLNKMRNVQIHPEAARI